MDENLKAEDKFTYKVEKITGAYSGDAACGVFRRRLVFADETAGTLVSCVLLSGDEENLNVFLGDIFELCVKRLEDSNVNILDSLKLAREAGIEYCDGRDVKSNFIHCFFYEDACYVLRFGDEIKLMSVNGSEKGEIDVELGSGPIRDKQIFLIATRKFLDIFDTKVLTDAENMDLEEIIDGLGTSISAISDQAKIGAAFVMVKEGNKNGREGQESEESRVVINGGEDKDGELIGGMKVNENIEGIGEAENFRTVDHSQIDQAALREAPLEVLNTRKFKIANPLSVFFKGFFSEIHRLRSGDLRAVFRLRRNIVLLSLIVVLVLVGSVSYNLYTQNQRTKKSQVTVYLANATSKYNEALAISTINKERARTLLVDADNELKSALVADPKNTDVNNLKNEIASKLKETESATSVNFETVGEFGDTVGGMAFSGKELAIVHGSKLSIVNVLSKKTNEIDIGASTKSVAVYSGSAFILTADKIKKVDLISEKVKEIASESGLDLDVFFGNVYSLGKDQIRKFVPIENGYSGSNYLNNKANFSDSGHLSIDSSVWVTAGDKILKFTRGNLEDFVISGLVNANYTLGAIYTNADIDNLYVVDSANSVLLVIDKKGVFKKVYQGKEFASVGDLVVDETVGKMYLAVGGKILAASL